jgi:transposase
MLHAGLDLSRKKLDVCLLSDDGEHLDQLAVPPDVDSLRTLARRIEEVHREPVCAVIESMTGARIVHDTLEACGWSVEIADAQKVKGLAPLACKTDKIDSMVLAVLSHRDLVPAIWLPDPRVREERELARFRLHLVKHKSALKCRIHSTLINFGRACPVTDLFGAEGRRLLERLEVPEPWRSNVTASVELIDDLEHQIADINRRLKEGHADHPYVPLLMSVPGIRWVLAFTIAGEIGEIERFSSPEKLTSYTGLCPRQPVRREGPPRAAHQARAHLPALGAAGGDNARAQASRLRGALPAQQAQARQAARRQGHPDRHRPPPRPRDLAHADPKPTLRSKRRRFSSGGDATILLTGATDGIGRESAVRLAPRGGLLVHGPQE